MLVLTAAATLALDLVTAVVIGLAVAVVLALRAVARSARLEQVPLDRGDHSAEEHALLAEHIVAYRLDGPLFFAAAHRFLLELTEVADVRVVILRMSRVSTIDATGALVLGDAIDRLRAARHHRAALRHHPRPRPGAQHPRGRRRAAPRGAGLPGHPGRDRHARTVALGGADAPETAATA